MSWDNNNLACILVFPPWQRKGLGQTLMGVSYELSRREGRLGGPEKRKTELAIDGVIVSVLISQQHYRAWEGKATSLTGKQQSREVY